MKTDTTELKPRLREYLQRKGVQINNDKLRCPNPAHMDKNPSAVIYENPSGKHVVTCNSQCGTSWDIFEIAGMLDNCKDFPEQLKAVQDALGITPAQASPSDKKNKQEPVLLSKDDARKVYTKKAALKISEFIYTDKKTGQLREHTIAAQWPYFDRYGKLICMDIRFEFKDGKKDVLTFWYNGKNLKTKNPPNTIYNQEEIFKNPDKPVLIVEGCKCAEIAGQLEYFIPCTWNGGTNRVRHINWSILENREIFILPDDDEPGLKAAEKIKEQLPQSKIISPPEGIREIKKKGGDIEEALQIMSPEELTKYILESPGIPVPGPTLNPAQQNTHTPPKNTPGTGVSDESSIPFRCLGIADDNYAYFLDETDRLRSWSMDTMSKSKLLVLAPRRWWKEEYGHDGKISWDRAIDEIIRISLRRDFNMDNVRGRGAWRERDGRICYHNGMETIGEYDKDKLFLRKPKIDIGINDKPASIELCKKIKECVFKMSFETKVDAVRCLGWSVLAPFAGALPWRPAILVTGKSGSGKTTLANEVIKPLSVPVWLDGMETTPAYLRSRINKDSSAIVFEEFDGDTKKKKENRAEHFSTMRSSTSDDAPDSGKGTKDGGYRSSKMQNMFAFIGTDPTIDNVADENRIFRVNMVMTKNKAEWKKIKTELDGILTEKNCRAVRALTWSKLDTILKLASRLADIVMEKAQKDFRSSLADGILCSAYIIIFGGMEKPTDKKLNEFFENFYALQPPEESRDDAEEVIGRLLDEIIEIIHSGRREKITIMEGLKRIYTGPVISDGDDKVTSEEIRETRLAIARYGIKLLENGELAICNKHHMIRQIIQRGWGYAKLFKRHEGFVEASRTVSFPDTSRRCTIIKGLVDIDEDVALGRLIF